MSARPTTTRDWPGEAAVAAMFEHPTPSIELDLERVAEPRILWLNTQAATQDPWFHRLGADQHRFEQHLLDRCAWQLPEAEPAGTAADTPATGRAAGHADRYGGVGIGVNGGSGRAAFVHQYHVKGIGRTPLVSPHTDLSHASGGAYLEEMVRDVIFTEIVRAEFPHSAVPILALIDTGRTRTFHWPTWTQVERCVLAVRPAFLRPAHFMRASFACDDPKDGARDARRVEWLFERSTALRGGPALVQDYVALFGHWARQLAYGYVHRLSHGSSTVSNIALDGRLLDFGAMSAMPSWADAAVMMARQPFSAHVQLLPRLVRSTWFFFDRHLGRHRALLPQVDALCDSVQLEFRRAMVFEALRLLGLDRGVAGAVAAGPGHVAWWNAVVGLVARFEHERIDMVESTPALRLPWDVLATWDDPPPPHLAALRRLLDELVPAPERALCVERCTFISRTRPALFREEAKRAIAAAIEHSAAGLSPCREQIGDFIDRWVASNRRDSRVVPAHVVTIGFAVRAGSSLVLCRDAASGRLLAIDEGEPASRGGATLWPVAEITPTTVRFADPARAEFQGAISLHLDHPSHEDHPAI